MPNYYKKIVLKGYVEVNVQDMSGKIVIPIRSYTYTPKLVCTKELYSSALGHHVIRIAHKQGRKQEFKVQFRNPGKKQLSVEFSFQEKEEDEE